MNWMQRIKTRLILLTSAVYGLMPLSCSTQPGEITLLVDAIDVPPLLASEVTAEPQIIPITIRNASKIKWNVFVESTSCGCVSVRSSNGAVVDREICLSIDAGADVSLKVHIRPSRESQVQALRLVAHSSDGRSKDLIVKRISIPVVEDLKAEPAALILASDDKNPQVQSKQLLIHRALRSKEELGKAPFLINAPSEVRSVAIAKVSEDKGVGGLWSQSWRCNFVLNVPKLVSSQSICWLQIQSSPDNTRAINVPLTFVRKYGLHVLPEIGISFGVLRISDKVKRRFLLETIDHKPFAIKRITSSLTHLLVDNADLSASSERRILSASFFSAKAGKYTGTILIETDYSLQPFISVPFDATVEEDRKTERSDEKGE